MDLSIERNESGYETSLPRRGVVYDFIDTAINGPGNADRLRAVVALGKSGDPRAVRPLADLLSDTEPEIRRSAIAALGQLKSGRPVDDLLLRLRDPGELIGTREQAALALSAIRSTGALRGLREFALDGAEDPGLRAFVGELLKGMAAW